MCQRFESKWTTFEVLNQREEERTCLIRTGQRAPISTYPDLLSHAHTLGTIHQPPFGTKEDTDKVSSTLVHTQQTAYGNHVGRFISSDARRFRTMGRELCFGHEERRKGEGETGATTNHGDLPPRDSMRNGACGPTLLNFDTHGRWSYDIAQ